jgi:hypothetical protein
MSVLDIHTTLTPCLKVSSERSGLTLAAAYLKAHDMSDASHRYAVFLWAVFGVLVVVYSVAHHLRAGLLSTKLTRWGMRRRTINGYAFASNSVILIAGVVAVAIVVLSVAGDNYIGDTGAMFRRDLRKSPLWAYGSRFGTTAFALTPLAVLLILRSPFAIFSWPFLTALHADKLVVFHRMAGWAIFLATTFHVVLWTIQLFKDHYAGRPMWFAAFRSIRFVFGCTAYACMCALMALSLRPVRQHRFELFFWTHVVLVVATLVTSVVHHPQIWYWIAIAGVLWFCDRAWRHVRYVRINSGAVAVDIELQQRSTGYDTLVPLRLYDTEHEALLLARYASKAADHSAIPVGCARAQLLPSRTVRLTIRLARGMAHAPGQSVLLTLPDLSPVQAHPFTICNNDRNVIVLLVKARKGLTRELHDMVQRSSPGYIRAYVEGPTGSSVRVRWDTFSTVLIICGGSGVSFGLSLCDYLCSEMALRRARTTRIRFVWVVREYADIAWAAAALCHARESMSATELEIDIYVTQQDKLDPPRFPDGLRPSTDSLPEHSDAFVNEMQNARARGIDISLYDGDSDIDDPAQTALSRAVQQQGKVRRAHSRRRAEKRPVVTDTSWGTALDDPLRSSLDEGDYVAMNILSELARSGHPKLDEILDLETDRSDGNLSVASESPVVLS